MVNVHALRAKIVERALSHFEDLVERSWDRRKLLSRMANHWARTPFYPKRFRDLAEHNLDLKLDEEERQTVLLLAAKRALPTIQKRKSLNPLHNAITEEATEWVWLRADRDDDYEVWRRKRTRAKKKKKKTKKNEEMKTQVQPRKVPLAPDDRDGLAPAAGHREWWSIKALEIRIRAGELEAFCYEEVGREAGELISTMRKTGPNRAEAARALGWPYDKVRYYWEKILETVERDFEPDPDSESD